MPKTALLPPPQTLDNLLPYLRENFNRIQDMLAKQFGTTDLHVGAVDSTILADNSVTTPKIVDNAVITQKILDAAISTVKLADAAVSTIKIQDAAILTAKLADNAVSLAKLAALSVDTSKLVDGAVTNVKIGAAAVDHAKLAVNAVQSDIIQAAAVITTKIADDAITTQKILANAVTAAKIAAHTITANEIAADTITATEIAANAITTSELAALAVTAAKIAANTITAAQIAANTITAAQIAAGTITTTEIAANTITAGNIAALTITAAQIAAATITGAKIAAGTVAASNMVANTITAASGIVHDLAVDILTAGNLSAAVILTGSIKTGTTGLRVESDANGVRLYGYAVPFVRSTGLDGSGTGAVSVPLPPIHLTNDILVLKVWTEGDETAPTTPAGWTKKDEVASGAGTTDIRLTVYWKRDGGAETNPSLASTTHRQIAFITAYGGCTTAGDPFDVTQTSSSTTSSTAASITGATSTLPNTLILAIIATQPTVSVGNIEYQSFTNANLTDLGEVKETSVYSATGGRLGSLGEANGIKDVAAAYGATTCTLDSASRKAMWSGALKADLTAVINLDTTTGNGTFTGTITGSKFYTPRQTGDRAVYGVEAIATNYLGTGVLNFLGAGMALYRNLDTEGPTAYSGLLDWQVYHDAPWGAGTGNQTAMYLAAVGSDDTDKSSARINSGDGSKENHALLRLSSGYWATAAGLLATPYFEFAMTHWDGATRLRSDAILQLIDGNNTQFSGIQLMPDLIKARNLVQNGSGTLTYPGAQTTTTALTVTWPQAFASTPIGGASAPTGTAAFAFRMLVRRSAGTSTTGTYIGTDVFNTNPANGTAASFTWTIGGPST